MPRPGPDRGLCPRGARARRDHDPLLRHGRRLRPSTGAARGAARRRGGTGLPDDRRAAGLRLLHRRPARAAAWSRARRGPDLRSTAEDPGAGRRGGRVARDGRRGSRSRRARGRAAQGRGRSRSSTRSRPSRTPPAARSGSTDARRLAELAAEHDLPILEDDPYGRVRYEGEPLPSVHALEGGSGSRSPRRSRRRWHPGSGSAISSSRRGSSRRTTIAPSRPTSRRACCLRRRCTS